MRRKKIKAAVVVPERASESAGTGESAAPIAPENANDGAKAPGPELAPKTGKRSDKAWIAEETERLKKLGRVI